MPRTRRAALSDTQQWLKAQCNTGGMCCTRRHLPQILAQLRLHLIGKAAGFRCNSRLQRTPQGVPAPAHERSAAAPASAGKVPAARSPAPPESMKASDHAAGPHAADRSAAPRNPAARSVPSAPAQGSADQRQPRPRAALRPSGTSGVLPSCGALSPNLMPSRPPGHRQPSPQQNHPSRHARSGTALAPAARLWCN